MDQADPQDTVKRAELMKQRAEARKKWLESVKVAINSAGDDENVRILLRFLAQETGFFLSPVVLKDGEVVVQSSLYNAARETVYHDFRKLMDPNTKNLVERSENDV